MTRCKFITLIIILVLSIPYTYGGCVLVFTSGDIEREKDPEDSESPTVFAGRTTPAVIDSANANDLSGGAFAGGITRIEAASAGFNQDSMATQIGAFRPLRLPLILQDSFQKVEIEIFGTFYLPDHGFVNLTTTEPFLVHHEDDWPTSGLIVLKGGRNTQAELSALDQLTYSVAADTDGDGVLDWDSGTVNWTDM